MAFVLCSGPAFAGCPAEIAGLTLADGAVQTVQGREGDVVSIWHETAEYAVGFEHLAGVIPLRVQGVDGPMEYDWATTLPALADIVPGATFILEGTLRAADGYAEAVKLQLRVLGPGQVTVGDCTLDVMRVETVDWIGGQMVGTITLFLHLPSLMVLRSETKAAEGPWVTEAVALR